jgi:probable HAF family extracellular repeat protein
MWGSISLGLLDLQQEEIMSPLNLEKLEDRYLLSYSVTDLGTLGGQTSAAYGLNAAGDAVGESDLPTGQYGDAFLYSGGVMTDLGKITSRGSIGYGVNAADQVVGVSYDIGTQAFLWQDGVMMALGTLGGSESAAFSINDVGQIVGDSKTPQVQYHAFLYQDGVMSDLGTLGGTYSAAYAINASGQITGDSTLSSGADHHTFFYSDGVMSDLGTLGGANSYANGINDAGQVAGWSNFQGGSQYDAHAYLYDGTSMIDLGTLPGGTSSVAYGINNAGQVVGYSYPAGSGSDYFHAFLYSDGTMTDLNDLLPPESGWVLKYAYAINDAGQIAGEGQNPDGVNHAFLLTPDGGHPHVDSVRLPVTGSSSTIIAPLLEPVFVPNPDQTNSATQPGEGVGPAPLGQSELSAGSHAAPTNAHPEDLAFAADSMFREAF